MAITDYASLQAAAANWLVRRDLTARIKDFIQLAEARLNREHRKRQGEVEASLTSIANSRFIPLPAGYVEALTVWITLSGSAQRTELRFVDPAKMDIYSVPAQPYGWTIDGTNLAFERPCDQAYAITMRYLSTYALSDASPTNALLTDAPDVYLFAVLSEAGPFLRNDNLAQTYEARFIRAVSQLNAKDARSRAQQKLPTEPAQLLLPTRGGGLYNIKADV